MSLKIELRFAVLTALIVLLFLIMEFVVGLQDTFIVWHPYVSLLAYFIPVFTYRLALIEKTEDRFGKLSLAQAFLCGFVITILLCLLIIPVQWLFHQYINPDFFSNMILYAVKTGKQTPENAAVYFNLKSYIIESVLGFFVIGTIISLILGFKMRTIK